MTRRRGLLTGGLLVSLTVLLSGCLLFEWPPTGPLGNTEEGASYYDGIYRMVLTAGFVSGTDGLDAGRRGPRPRVPRINTRQILFMEVYHIPIDGSVVRQNGDLEYSVNFYNSYDPITGMLSGDRGSATMSFEGNPSYTFTIGDDSYGFMLHPDHPFCEFIMNGAVWTIVDEAIPGADNSELQRSTQLFGHHLAWCTNDGLRDERQEGEALDIAFGSFEARWIAPRDLL